MFFFIRGIPLLAKAPPEDRFFCPPAVPTNFDFSKKIILNNKNIKSFFKSIEKKKYKKETDLYLGFFGYEILCSLLNLSLKNQKKMNFYKGIFYKPETLIKIRNKIIIHFILYF